ncbi:EVE domain-containing protein [Afifella sp. IM 167]|uniref:EVE domain-containing protein n=1 Tax=Afifella sp. IM 167 TaxID=2033586 RepID=UPI001CCD55AC|nr:EVE domain-containing protein [Afifella sp. IM 167]MBZ8134942.1 ubiquinol-cytochrome C reductase [Afifella sp. IM 167]
MGYWLFKSEPHKWSWDDQVKKGAGGQEWDGVRNYQARNFMRAMKKGERGFFYHSNEGKAVVGVVEIVAEAHPDSTDGTGKWECVDIKAVAPLKNPVTLDDIKADGRLDEMVLVKNSRLSVQPVSWNEFQTICALGGIDPNEVKAG